MNSYGSSRIDEPSQNQQTPLLVRPYDQVQEEFVGLSPSAQQSGIFPEFFSEKKVTGSLQSAVSAPVFQSAYKDDGVGKLIALNEQLRFMQLQQEQMERVKEHPAGKILYNVSQKKAKSVMNELFQAFGSQLWPFEWNINPKPKSNPPEFECEFNMTELKIPGCKTVRNVVFKVSDTNKNDAMDKAACTALCWLQDEGYLPPGRYSEEWKKHKVDVKPEIKPLEEGRAVSLQLPSAVTHVRMVLQDYERAEPLEELIDVDSLKLPSDSTLEKLELQLGYRFGKKNILRQACHHASCGQVNWKKLCTLGAAALNYIVVFLLAEVHPELEPSALTTRKNEILKREKFEEFASKLGLDKFMVVQFKFAQKTPSAAMLVEMFEAIVGAIDLDGGPHQSRAFLKRLLGL